MTPFKLLETVVLMRDVPESGLRVGDLGAIVHLYGAEAESEPEAIDVEFVTASGHTQAVQLLRPSDLRAVRDDDVLAVRSTASTRGAA
ncbi:MAG: DUF4926 domain-containing protein [Gemmatimonadaceae bacterium]|jgi:hypothetical protein|nr:DUF4926 domain-containing protein [Gemmatimonadaceae bacterium]